MKNWICNVKGNNNDILTEMTGDGTITATTMGRTSRGVIGISMVMMMIIISIILLVGTSRTNHTTIIRIRRRKWPYRDASRFYIRMITFDPMDTGIPNPLVYIASSLLFRGEESCWR
jgi:hypothetical protein